MWVIVNTSNFEAVCWLILFPNTQKLLKIPCIIPVEMLGAERSFLCSRWIHNRSWVHMDQLKNLAFNAMPELHDFLKKQIHANTILTSILLEGSPNYWLTMLISDGLQNLNTMMDEQIHEVCWYLLWIRN